MHKQFWEMGIEGMQNFIDKYIRSADPCYTDTSRQNLTQRKFLEDRTRSIQDKQEDIQEKLLEMKKTQDILENKA